MKYDYLCEISGNGPFEMDFPMGQAPEQVECPTCGRPARRHYSVPAIHYFGNGWTTKRTHDHPDGSVKKAMKMWEQSSTG